MSSFREDSPSKKFLNSVKATRVLIIPLLPCLIYLSIMSFSIVAKPMWYIIELHQCCSALVSGVPWIVGYLTAPVLVYISMQYSRNRLYTKTIETSPKILTHPSLLYQRIKNSFHYVLLSKGHASRVVFPTNFVYSLVFPFMLLVLTSSFIYSPKNY